MQKMGTPYASGLVISAGHMDFAVLRWLRETVVRGVGTDLLAGILRARLHHSLQDLGLRHKNESEDLGE